MKKFYFSFLIICIFQINLVTTRAQLYWSESFGASTVTSNYIDGQNINGLNSWEYQGATNTGYKAKIGTPLTYGNLLTDATYFVGGGAWETVGVGIPVINTTPFFNAYNGDGQWQVAGYKAGGSNEFWYSMLIRADQAKDFSIGFHSDNIRRYIQASSMLVNRSNAGEWSIQVDGTTTSTGVTIGTGQTLLLVCKINFEADGTRLTAFINPTLGVTPTGGVSGKTLTPKLFKSIGFYLSSDPDKFSIDELRIGATYADVTPAKANLDTQAPTAPTALVSSAVSDKTFTLSWTASTDNVGVTGYDVYKDGTLVGSSATTSLDITGINPATTYLMTVKAKDDALNISTASNPLSVTTLNATVQLATWDLKGVDTAGGIQTAAVTTKDAGVTVSNLTVNSGMGSDATAFRDGITGTSVMSTTLAASIIANNYIEFTITPASGKQISISSIDVSLLTQTSSTFVYLLSSVGGFAADKAILSLAATGNTTNIPLQNMVTVGHNNLTSAVTFRFYFTGLNYNAYGIGDRNSTSTADLIINGTIAPKLVSGIEQNRIGNALIYCQNRQIVTDLSAVSGVTRVTVFDVKGSMIHSIQSKGSELLKINVPSKGLYMVRLQNGDKQTTQKVVL